MGSPNSSLIIEIFSLIILISYLIILFFIIVITSRKFYLFFDSKSNGYKNFIKKLIMYLLVIEVVTFILSIGLNIISVYILSSNNYITSRWVCGIIIVAILFLIYLIIFMAEIYFYKKNKLDIEIDPKTKRPFKYFIIAILALITCSLALFFGTYSKYIHIVIEPLTHDTKIQETIWCLTLIDIVVLCYCIIYITKEIIDITNKDLENVKGDDGNQVITRIEDRDSGIEDRDSGGWHIL